MKNFLIAILFAVLSTFPLHSEPAPVRSGEHDAFTRLVVPLKGSGWSVAQTGRKVVLSFEEFDDGFEVEGIFDLIPRNRVKAVQPSADKLTIQLACDCAVSAVTERELYVVIDVADTPSALKTALLKPESGAPSNPTNNATNTLAPQAVIATIRPPKNSTENHLPDHATEIADDLQNRVSDELRKASHRGLLSAVPDRKNSWANKTFSVDQYVSQPTTSATIVPASANDTANQERANVRISTSRDLPETFRDLAEIISADGVICPPDNVLNVSSWGDARSFAEQISEARQGLFLEFDRIDSEAARRLAKTYLFFGFGAEARDVLRLAPIQEKDAPLLLAVAKILDGEPLEPENLLSELAECHGATLLWAMLASPIPADGSFPKSDSALRTLDSLPAHLRVVLAPRLSEILLAYGDPTNAAIALRSLDRLPDNLPPAARLAQARNNLGKGKTKTATQQLEKVVNENADQSPEALIVLIKTNAQEGHPISVEHVALIEAYAQEYKGTDIGRDLESAFVIALVETGQFDRAYNSLARLDETGGTKATLDLRLHMLGRLVSSSNDMIFLSHVFSQPDQDIAAMPEADLMALAKRFLSLGFFANAERTLAHLAIEPRQKDKQLLSASISLAMKKPFRAQADLLGLVDPEADLLRADAKQMLGDHDEAHILYAGIGRQQDATNSAWLSTDWQRLITRDTPVFGPVSAMQSDQQEGNAGDGMLSRSNEILSRSAEMRIALKALLSSEDLRVPLPEE